MSSSERAKERMEEVAQDLKESIERLRQEVSELNRKLREKLSGEGLRGVAGGFGRDIRQLAESLKKAIPLRRKGRRLPVRIEKSRAAGGEIELLSQPILELRDALNQVFEDFFKGIEGLTTSGLGESGYGLFSPDVDISEDEKQIEITVEVPGVDPKDISVELEDDVITIRGEKKQEEERKGRQYYQMERIYGAFQRSFQLPFKVEESKVEATFSNGILRIVLPKSEEAMEKVKKIHIKTQ